MRRLWFQRIGVVCLCLAIPLGIWLTIDRLTSAALVPQASDDLPTMQPTTSEPVTVPAKPSAEPTPSSPAPTVSQRPSPMERTTVTLAPPPTRSTPRAPRTTRTRVATPPPPTRVVTPSPRPSSTVTTHTPTPRPSSPTPSATRTATATPSPSAGDQSPPSKVTGLWLSEVTDRTYTVAWNAATDNVAVTRYIVDVDGEAHLVTGTQFSGPLPVAGTTSFVQVRAEDAAGNVGRWSDPLIIELEAATPTPDVSPPAMSDSPNDRADQQPPN